MNVPHRIAIAQSASVDTDITPDLLPFLDTPFPKLMISRFELSDAAPDASVLLDIRHAAHDLNEKVMRMISFDSGRAAKFSSFAERRLVQMFFQLAMNLQAGVWIHDSPEDILSGLAKKNAILALAFNSQAVSPAEVVDFVGDNLKAPDAIGLLKRRGFAALELVARTASPDPV